MGLAGCSAGGNGAAASDPLAAPAEGGGMFSNEPVPEDQKSLPVSLQYRHYTADTARDSSLAGDVVNGQKENHSYKGKSVTASNESDLDLVLNTRAALPADGKLILIAQAANNAQCFHKIEPSALLPCQMPKSMEDVEASLEDVRRAFCCKDSTAMSSGTHFVPPV